MRNHRNFVATALRILCFVSFAVPALAAPEKPKAPLVMAERVKADVLFDLLMFPAKLIPKINATLLSDSDGIVNKIVTTLGQSVEKGQKVCLIANTDPVYDYLPLTMIAPVSGVISSVEITEGSRVTKGQRLATITDPSQVKISVEIPAADLSVITPGLNGELHVASREDAIAVKVKGVSPFVDAATGTASAELTIVGKNAARRLPPGLVGRVTFRAREHSGIQIPEPAVVYQSQETFVRVIEQGKVKLIPVQLGQTRRGFVEVVKGLDAGAHIVVRSSSFVGDGDEVTVQEVGKS